MGRLAWSSNLHPLAVGEIVVGSFFRAAVRPLNRYTCGPLGRSVIGGLFGQYQVSFTPTIRLLNVEKETAALHKAVA